MIAHELTTGLRIESARRTVALVDTSKGTIDISARALLRREFAASRAGLRAAVDLLGRLSFRHPGQVPVVPPQLDLFGSAPPRDRDAFEQAELEELVLSALRRTARARCELIDQAEAAVAAEESTPMVLSGSVLALPYLVNDLLRFRAAAIAVSRVERLPAASERVEDGRALVANLAHWRALFSPTGQVSRALNKTLNELPPGALGRDVWALRRVHLERPVLSDLHLRILAELSRVAGPHLASHTSVVQHVEEEELHDLRARAVRVLRAEHADERPKDHMFAELIASAGAVAANRSLRALLRPALARRRRFRRGDLSDDMPTRQPPLPIPPGVRLLASVGEVIQEGVDMKHCVGAHAVSAVNGWAFIFHVVVNDEHATVEVNEHGRVRDASGPCNQQNRASEHGSELLRAWGAGFWAARVGGLELSTSIEPAPPVRHGFAPLATVAACLSAFHLVAASAGGSFEALALWFEQHVERAVAGQEWLIARLDTGRPAVMAVDLSGRVLDTLMKRGAPQG